jgi:hypothetical protein
MTTHLHWRAVRETNAKFIEPMLLQAAESLPEGPDRYCNC